MTSPGSPEIVRCTLDTADPPLAELAERERRKNPPLKSLFSLAALAKESSEVNIKAPTQAAAPAQKWRRTAGGWAVERLYLSLPLQGSASERVFLRSVCLPAIREYAEGLKVKVVDVELRAGCDPNNKDHMAILATACLTELSVCQSEGQALFVSVLGDVYGELLEKLSQAPIVRDAYPPSQPSLSLQHLELHAGALRDANPNALVLLRSLANPEAVARLKGESLKRGLIADPDPARLTNLKKAIRTTLNAAQIVPYKVHVDERGRATGLTEVMGPAVTTFLKRRLTERHGEEHPVKNIYFFVLDRNTHTVGRAEICRQLKSLLQMPAATTTTTTTTTGDHNHHNHHNNNNNNNTTITTDNGDNDDDDHNNLRIVSVVGPSGCGKTSALAVFAKNLIHAHSPLACYFADAHAHPLTLSEIFASLVDEDREISAETTVIIDGCEDPALLKEKTLRAAFPGGGRIVLGVREEHLAPGTRVPVPPLFVDDQRDMLARFAGPRFMDSSLSDDLVQTLLTPGAERTLPLYLKAAVSLAKLQPSVDRVKETVRSLPSSLLSLLGQLFTALERRFGLDVVRNSVSLLKVARAGLHEHELRDLVMFAGDIQSQGGQQQGSSEEVMASLQQAGADLAEAVGVSALAWREVLETLTGSAALVREQPSDGALMLAHPLVSEVVEARYLKDRVVRGVSAAEMYHAQLARYFKAVSENEARKVDLTSLSRAQSELRYHQARARVPLEVIVGVRVRPRSSAEVARGEPTCVTMEGNRTFLASPHPDRKPAVFSFDYSFWSCHNSGRPELQDAPLATQTTVFNTLGVELLGSLFAGQVSTLVAYGQTGSGKTHSVFGAPGEHDGMLWAFCKALFERAESEGRLAQRVYKVRVSMLEIYNDRVYDLLRDKVEERVALRVRERARGEVFVEGLNVLEVGSYEETRRVLERGELARKVDATQMNERSSRAHTVATIDLSWAGGSNQINIVDLAGSERASRKVGQSKAQLLEGTAINISLSVLNRCIAALASGLDVPYRDTTLTYLLRRALSGNSRIIMLATVSPCLANHYETMTTLQYARLAKPAPASASQTPAQTAAAAAAAAAAAGTSGAAAPAAILTPEALVAARALVDMCIRASDAVIEPVWEVETLLGQVTHHEWSIFSDACYTASERVQTLGVALCLLLSPGQEVGWMRGRRFVLQGHERFMHAVSWNVDLSALPREGIALVEGLATRLRDPPERAETLFDSPVYKLILRWLELTARVARTFDRLEVEGEGAGRRMLLGLMRARDSWNLTEADLDDLGAAVVAEVFRKRVREFAKVDLSSNRFTDAGVLAICDGLREAQGGVRVLDISNNPGVGPASLLQAATLIREQGLSLRFTITRPTSYEGWCAVADALPPGTPLSNDIPAVKLAIGAFWRDVKSNEVRVVGDLPGGATAAAAAAAAAGSSTKARPLPSSPSPSQSPGPGGKKGKRVSDIDILLSHNEDFKEAYEGTNIHQPPGHDDRHDDHDQAGGLNRSQTQLQGRRGAAPEAAWPRGDAGAFWISAFIPYALSLTRLDLSDLGLGDNGAAALAGALRKNTTVHTLLLRNNPKLGDTGVGSLVQVVRNYQMIQTLDCDGCMGISARGVKLLAKSLVFKGELAPEVEASLLRQTNLLRKILAFASTRQGRSFGAFGEDSSEEARRLERLAWETFIPGLSLASLSSQEWAQLYGRVLFPFPAGASPERYPDVTDKNLAVCPEATFSCVNGLMGVGDFGFFPRNRIEKSIVEWARFRFSQEQAAAKK